jgi:tetratricopeptide (TPR) repeat protein
VRNSFVTDRAFRTSLRALLLATAFIFGIVKIADPDAWTHLALGRAIVQHRGFPATELFNFPTLSMPYYNPEWLFDIVFYLFDVVAGIPGVILLKASLATIAFYILLKDSSIPLAPASHAKLDTAMTVTVSLAMLLIVRHRFVERPDLVLMIFLGFTMYALNAYVYENKRYILLLPVMQVLWINMHPSVVVGLVPFMAFLVGGQLQRFLGRRFGLEIPGTPSVTQLRTIAGVFTLILGASLLNPYGIKSFLIPFQVAGSRWFRDEILELQRPSLDEWYGAPYIVSALLGLVFLLWVKRLSIVSVLLVLPFVYLGLSARRFVFLLAIVSGPVLVRHLRLFIGRLRSERSNVAGLVLGATVAVLIIAASGFFITGQRPLADPFRVPGFGINYEPYPEGALRYLDRIGMTGRLYNPLKWGGYIAWRDYPGRLTIIDGRGYVPSGLLDPIHSATGNPAAFRTLQQKYGFEAAVVEFPKDAHEVFGSALPDFDLGLPVPEWALVYWDDLSLVYLKRGDRFSEVIERDEYRHVKPANGITGLKQKLRDPNLFEAVVAELKRNIAETQSSIGYMYLGLAYIDAGDFAKAIEVLSQVRNFPLRNYIQNANIGLGFAHDKLGRTQLAISYYQKPLKLGDPEGKIHYSLGRASQKMGKNREAVRYLERALEQNPGMVLAYPALIDAYRRLGETEPLLRLETAFRNAQLRNQADRHFERGLRFYSEGKLKEALIEFQETLRINPKYAVALSNIGYIYYDKGDLSRALALQQQALQVDPNHANAHYGLALIYRDRENNAKAIEHFKEYIRLEPGGYWSRQARDELSRMTNS